MDESEQSLEVIVERIAKLEAKVALFEAKYGPLDAPGETFIDRARIGPQYQQVPPPIRPMSQVPPRQRHAFDWERVGRVWLPIVFIVAILMGVAFLFDAAVKAGLLNQQARLVVGYVGSAAVLAVGELQLARGRRVLGDVLVGAGVAIMLLTTFAGNHLYRILNLPIAVVLGLLFTAAGAYLARRHCSQTLAVIATLGGSLVVLMLSTHPADPVFVALYALVVSTGFVWFSLSQQFRAAFFVAWLTLHFDLCVFALTSGHLSAVFAWVVLVQHVAVAAYLFVRRPTAGERYALFYLSLAATGLWSPSLTHGQARLEFLLLGLAYVVTSVYLYLRKQATQEGLHLAVLGSLFGLALFFAYALHGENRVLAFVLEGALGVIAGLWLRLGAQMWLSCLLYAISWLLVLSVAPAGTRVYLLFGRFVGEDFVIDLLATASAAAVVAVAARLSQKDGEESAAAGMLRFFRWFAPAVFILFLSNGLLTVLQGLHSDVKMLAVSFLWAVLAVVLVLVGVRRDRRRERAMGILLLFITLAKLVAVDLPFVPVVLRAVLFIGVGTIGVFASRLFYGTGKK